MFCLACIESFRQSNNCTASQSTLSAHTYTHTISYSLRSFSQSKNNLRVVDRCPVGHVQAMAASTQGMGVSLVPSSIWQTHCSSPLPEADGHCCACSQPACTPAEGKVCGMVGCSSALEMLCVQSFPQVSVYRVSDVVSQAICCHPFRSIQIYLYVRSQAGHCLHTDSTHVNNITSMYMLAINCLCRRQFCLLTINPYA